MKTLSGLGRALKSVIGWLFVLVFGGTGVYSLLDATQDGPAVIAVCFLLACAGLALIRSARREKRKIEGEREEEKQYRRHQEQQAQERRAQEKREAIRYVAVTCPGCGAIGRVRKGSVGRCEYCDTPLEGK